MGNMQNETNIGTKNTLKEANASMKNKKKAWKKPELNRLDIGSNTNNGATNGGDGKGNNNNSAS